MPDPPVAVRVVSVGEESCIVQWDPPLFDGGQPIIGKKKKKKEKKEENKRKYTVCLICVSKCNATTSFASVLTLRLCAGEEEDEELQVDEAEL